MADVIDAGFVLRVLNHHLRRHRDAGDDQAELAPLEDCVDWVRGMVALDRMGAAAVEGQQP